MTPQPWPRTGAGNGQGWQAEVRPLQVRPGLLRPAPRPRHRRRQRGHLRRGHALRRLGLSISAPAPDNVEGHPFHAANNVNGIGITSIVDYQVLPLDPRVQALQEAYIRKVVDTVHDLPNVLYEVANESSGGGAVDQDIRRRAGTGRCIARLGRLDRVAILGDRLRQASTSRSRGTSKHPIGMTMQFPVADQTKVNDPLFNSPADWISPGYDDEIFADGRPSDGAWQPAVALVSMTRPPATAGRS